MIKNRLSKLILIFVVLQTLLIAAIVIEVRFSANHHIKAITSRLQDEFRATRNFHADFLKNVLTFFVNSSCVLDVYKGIQEGDLTIEEGRKQLKKEVLPQFGKLDKSHIALLHFHQPDGTSFLRLHKPNEYGDSLEASRKEMQYVQKTGQPLFTFSEGESRHAFRYFLPLISSGKVIGSVAAGSSFNQYRSSMTDSFSGEYFLLLKKSASSNRQLEPLSFSKDYLYNIADLPSQENFQHQGHLDEKIILRLLEHNQKEINKGLVTNKAFDVYSRSMEGHFILAFVPEISVLSGVIGYKVAIVADRYIPDLLWTYIGVYLLTSILMIIIFWLYYHSRTLQENDYHFLQILMDSIPIPVFVRNAKGEYIKCNQAYKESVGVGINTIQGKTAEQIFKDSTAKTMREQDQEVYAHPDQKFFFETEVNRPEIESTSHFVVHKRSFKDLKGNLAGMVAAAMDVTPLKEQEKKQAELISQLQKALEEVKTLRGILPVCSHCRKIRDDQGYWQQLEDYLDKNSDLQVSHGVCEDCVKEHYPEFADSILKENNE